MMSPAAKAYAIELYEAQLEREREELRQEARAQADLDAEERAESSSDDEKAALHSAALPGVPGRPGSPGRGGKSIKLRPLNFLPKILEPTPESCFERACRENSVEFCRSPEGAGNLDFALCIASFPRRGQDSARYQRAELQRHLDSITPPADVCYQRGGFVAVEIPPQALYLELPCVKTFMARYRLKPCRFDSCCFGQCADSGSRQPEVA